MFVRLEKSSGIPINRQVADQIRAHCVNGTLLAGDRLPSVRELARELAVNQNTILHIYERLTHEGLLERRQGDGTYVADKLPPGRAKAQRESVIVDMERLAHRVIGLGIEAGAARRMFDESLCRAQKNEPANHEGERMVDQPISERPVIELRGVTKSFGKKQVLRGVNLSVPPGQTFAFLGRNGAGKTTTIRTLLGLLKPDGGEVRVLGLDPRKDGIEIRRRVGYVAEDPVLFGWMKVKQLMSFMAPFYPTWDAAWAKQLADRFELPMETKFKHLSKGQGVRVALLLALAHRPELVILDDPTLGLDPIMRKEFLRDLVTYLQGERVSVFFSSHLLYEIEPVADSVVILDHGRVVRAAATEDLREKVKRLIAPADAAPFLSGLPGLLDLNTTGRQTTAVVSDIDAVGTLPESVEVIDLNLDEIFEAYVIGRKEAGGATTPLERVA